MGTPEVNYIASYQKIARVWDSKFLLRGTFSRFLSKLLVPAPKDKVIAGNLHGFKMLLDPVIDNGVEKSLYYFGTYEKGTLDFIKHHLPEGGVFLDIGANIGLMSIYASIVCGASGKVFSFEANPETLEILKENISLNKITNIVTVGKAVGSKADKLKIYNNWSVNRGGATLIKPSGSNEGVDVDMIALDETEPFNSLRISMVKIDVEGFELDVLLGMKKILSASAPPVLIIECSADRNNNYESTHSIYDFVSSLGKYKIFKLSDTKERIGTLKEITTKNELPKHDNIFCMPST